MKKNRRCLLVIIMLHATLGAAPFLFGGCALYDWLVDQLEETLSPVSNYEVSVIDCKTILPPGSLLTFDSALASRISQSARDGVDELSKMPRFRNVRRVDRIPAASFPGFHDEFFSRAKSYEERTKILREYCGKYQNNILLWSAATGDDREIAFVAYLYRRDLDVVTETPPLKMTDRMSSRVQEELVSKAVTGLLQRSIDGAPGGSDWKNIPGTLRENKELILVVGALLLDLMLEGE